MAAFNKKDNRPMMFHSALAGNGPTRVTVDNEPKWVKTKNNYLVELTLHNSDGSQEKVAYWAENDGCGEFFKGTKGQTFTIIAKGGGKTDDEKMNAEIAYVGESTAATPPARPPTSAPPSRPAPHQHAAPPANRPRPDGLHLLKAFIGRNETAMKIALKRAVALKADFEAEYNTKMTDEMFHSMFSGMLYGASASGVVDSAPAFIEFKTLMPPASGVGAPATRAAAPPPPPPPPQPPPQPKCKTCGVANVENEGDECEPCAKTSDDVPF